MNMTMVVWILAALAVFLLAGRLARGAIALLLGPAIGRAALEKQPDTIQLVPSPDDAWHDAEMIQRIASLFVERGFAVAGDFSVPEMPGMHVRLLAHEAEAWYAAIYEHPIAGHWFDLFHGLEDGSSETWTTAPPTGLDDRPGHPTIRVPGAHPGELFERARRATSRAAARPATPDAASRDFAQAYAEAIAWRKARGVSRREVARVADRHARAA